MFDTSQIDQMNTLKEILFGNKFYQEQSYFVNSNSLRKIDKHRMPNDMDKITFGVKPKKDLNVVSIDIYFDCVGLYYHKTGKSYEFEIPESMRKSLTLEMKIIFALDSWKSYYTN